MRRAYLLWSATYSLDQFINLHQMQIFPFDCFPFHFAADIGRFSDNVRFIA